MSMVENRVQPQCNVVYKRAALTSEPPTPKTHQKADFQQVNISTTAKLIPSRFLL
jgi:hypothetical protein